VWGAIDLLIFFALFANYRRVITLGDRFKCGLRKVSGIFSYSCLRSDDFVGCIKFGFLSSNRNVVSFKFFF